MLYKIPMFQVSIGNGSYSIIAYLKKMLFIIFFVKRIEKSLLTQILAPTTLTAHAKPTGDKE
jgi:hypothetical protein